MGQLIPFSFENASIRTLDENGEIWIVAKDVLLALGYSESSKPAKVTGGIPEEWKGVKPIHTPGGQQDMLCLSEPGLYFFLARSDKPKALPFQKWLAGEVLPSIRKTGRYETPQSEQHPVSLSKVARDLRDSVAIANIFGFEGNQGLLSANRAIKKRHDFDCAEYIGATHLLSETQEVLLTVTELAQRAGLSVRQVNPMLEMMGLQEGYRDHKNKQCWSLTEAGGRYGQYLDTGKQHSDGTPVRQIKWFASALNLVRCAMEMPEIDLLKAH